MRPGDLRNIGHYAATYSQLVVSGALPWPAVNAASVYQGAVPAVINGEFMATELVDLPLGNPFVLNPNGTLVVNVNGSRARQLVMVARYDPRVKDWSAAQPTYLNNQVPVLAPNEAYSFSYPINVAIDPFDLTLFAIDGEGDPLAITMPSGVLPTGMVFDGVNAITGTPTVAGTFVANFVWADITGDNTGLVPFTFLIQAPFTLPSVVGLTQLAARTLLVGDGLTVTSNAPGDALVVRNQIPGAGSVVTVPSNVFLDTLSPSGNSGGNSQHRTVGGLR